MGNKQLLQKIFSTTDEVLGRYVLSESKKEIAALYLNSAIIKEYMLYLIEGLSGKDRYKAQKTLEEIEKKPKTLKESVKVLQSQISQEVIDSRLQSFVEDKLEKLVDQFIIALDKYLVSNS